MLKKIIINFWNPYTAIFRYVQMLGRLDNTHIINVVDNAKKWEYNHNGNDYSGKFKNSKFNTLLPFTSHKNLIHYLKSLSGENIIYHYTSQRDVLFYNNKNVLFTVHDNPFSQFKSNLYYNRNKKFMEKYQNYMKNIFLINMPCIQNLLP